MDDWDSDNVRMGHQYIHVTTAHEKRDDGEGGLTERELSVFLLDILSCSILSYVEYFIRAFREEDQTIERGR